MVRLARGAAGVRDGAVPFQSHCGSIGTGAAEQLTTRPARFQSHCGSIGTEALARATRVVISFNPTVVRLARGAVPYTLWVGIVSIPLWFDWHHLALRIVRERQFVSIPLWFDWHGALRGAEAVRSLVSIPLWFDWHLRRVESCYAYGGVSIPLWFDWHLDARQLFDPLHSFQSHCGSIGTPCSHTRASR